MNAPTALDARTGTDRFKQETFMTFQEMLLGDDTLDAFEFSDAPLRGAHEPNFSAAKILSEEEK